MNQAGLLRYRSARDLMGVAPIRLDCFGRLALAPKLYTSAEARTILRIGKTRMNDLLVSGELPSFKVGQRRRISEESLRVFIERQMTLAA
jgi:excisionase family DNA binding protein